MKQHSSSPPSSIMKQFPPSQPPSTMDQYSPSSLLPNPNPHRIARPIFSRVNFCEHVFDAIEMLYLERKDRRRFEHAHIRFLQWAKLIRIWRSQGQNLDSLLDPSRRPLRSQIENHLGNVQSSLVYALNSAKDVSVLPDGHFDPSFPNIESSLTQLEEFTYHLLIYTPAGLGCRVAAYRRRRGNPRFVRDVVEFIRADFPYLKPAIVSKEPWWCNLGLNWLVCPQTVQDTASDDEPAGLFKALADAIIFTHYKTLYEQDYGEQERRDAQDPEIASMRLPVEQSSVPVDCTPENQSDCPICGETCCSPSSGNLNPTEYVAQHLPLLSQSSPR
ncbi:hypothetical protein ISF_01767 [Cordyceps fumosorosea ARSEF 2679]|uniref:Uncharacterized protein n=1 Tax=Cordyceps fumosorosea (strain ARSEF 2679) TaxID=1081104 RepID=A0A168CCB1_CORFA|nr:hypothetical protein ISF_01767 [Cordyceps fumosorosea ARSEF 2679]OAA71216.1 hypothetical protein ISF_01767 [Cordyceps fumosorosea ARSEF 2679]